MNEILKVLNIEKYYGSKNILTKVLDNISFTIEKGEFVGIMGPSGSGKTTLLNCISTIDNVTSGNIFIKDIDITEIKSKKLSEFRGKEIGFLFQEYNLLDTMTGFENIMLPLSIMNVNYKEATNKINEISHSLDIDSIINKYPYEMSGGEKQRIAAARALVVNPSILLADEPTGALDSKSSRKLLEKLDTLNKDLKSTILMVTHDAFTASYCSRILFIKDGKLFNELLKGNRNRKDFFNEIIDIVTFLGGDADDDY
jgi:putative ABC transport system ATP-binding protein